MSDFLDLKNLIKEEKISGWGRKNIVNSKLVNFHNAQEIQTFLNTSNNLNCIPRGLGRSYGDAAQLNEDFVLNLESCNKILVSGNQVNVGGGVSISKLLEVIIPLGFFVL